MEVVPNTPLSNKYHFYFWSFITFCIISMWPGILHSYFTIGLSYISLKPQKKYKYAATIFIWVLAEIRFELISTSSCFPKWGYNRVEKPLSRVCLSIQPFYLGLKFQKLACSFLKKKLWHSCFPVNFAKFFKTPFKQNISGRLLLKRPLL